METNKCDRPHYKREDSSTTFPISSVSEVVKAPIDVDDSQQGNSLPAASMSAPEGGILEDSVEGGFWAWATVVAA